MPRCRLRFSAALTTVLAHTPVTALRGHGQRPPQVVVFSAGRRFGHPQCEAVGRYLPFVAHGLDHPTRCGVSDDYQPVEVMDSAVYMTETNGRIVVTSNGQSPLSLFCDGSPGCDVQIPH